jgi:hypothetical protein
VNSQPLTRAVGAPSCLILGNVFAHDALVTL